MVKEGEQVDESKPVMEIVDLDPLYVDVTLVDTSVVQRLKLGQKVQVRYADEQRGPGGDGRRDRPVGGQAVGQTPVPAVAAEPGGPQRRPARRDPTAGDGGGERQLNARRFDS